MSEPSPVPPNDGISGGVDWRASVQQSYRNSEVREIAQVLAALEPGATASSKLRLAMQFEDSVFKQATDLADYRKRLTKRLKKVQKTYVPTTTTASTTAVNNKASRLQQLRTKYGEAILYIVKHAETAVQQMRIKHGADKASQLRQHTDGVQAWAADLGLALDDISTSSTATPNVKMSDSDLDKLQSLLERRIENIRSHVVKLADPNRFLLETMEKTERDITDPASKLLARTCQSRYEQLSRTSNVDGTVLVQQALEAVNKSAPLPTRDQHNDTQAALIHLEKMRASSSLLLGWSLVPDKTTLPRNNIMSKAHATANEGIDFVTKVMAELRKGQGHKGVTLEDAWMKALTLPTPTIDALETSTLSLSSPPLRLSRPVVRSRVLLKPGRKPPSNLLPALLRKRAKLVRPQPHGEGSHLILDFGDAFTMTIYFVPLLVTLRAQEKLSSTTASTETQDNNQQHEFVGCATMTPLNHGLHHQQQPVRVWGTTGTVETLGRVVEERLRDASAHATHILRKCFEVAINHKENAHDFEIELLEATALLEFIQIARTTYIPDWQDDD